MRAFIAIDLSKEIKEYLSFLQAQLKKSNADVKWVAPDNLHITLKFLGEINEAHTKQVIGIIKSIASAHTQFHLKPGSIGAFPSTKSPRVLWVGLTNGDYESKEIAKKLESMLEKTGFPKEDTPFSSHITIGRARSNYNRDTLIQYLNKLSTGIQKEIPEGKITHITLFKSILTPKGPVYEIVAEENLATA
jgi:2'-5' RNA ligase